MIDYKLFTGAVILLMIATAITFLMKSIMIEVMLPLLMVVLVVYAVFMLFKSIRKVK